MKLLHFSRNGHCQVWADTQADPALLPSLKIFSEWLDTQAAKGVLPPHTLWRVLADHADPISKQVALPPLRRADRQRFIAQQHHHHLPDATAHWAEPVHGTRDHYLLHALPDKPLATPPGSPGLKACLDLLRAHQQVVESLLTPGQLLPLMVEEKIPSSPCLLSLPWPDASAPTEETLLVSLVQDGQYRFSRTMQHTPQLQEKLIPTLLAHHLLSRDTLLQGRILNAHPSALLQRFADAPAKSLPPHFKHPESETFRKDQQRATRQKRLMGGTSIICLLLSVFTLIHTTLLVRQTATLRESASASAPALPHLPSVPAHWQSLQNWLKTHPWADRPVLPAHVLKPLTDALENYPSLALHALHWERIDSPTLRLVFEPPETPAGQAALAALAEQLSPLGPITRPPTGTASPPEILIRLSSP